MYFRLSHALSQSKCQVRRERVKEIGMIVTPHSFDTDLIAQSIKYAY